jgi:serralysin
MAVFTYTFDLSADIPNNGTYSHVIAITGLDAHLMTEVSMSLIGVTHSFSGDLDVLLVGPDAGRNLQVMSDVGGTASLDDATLILSDDATQVIAATGGVIDSGVYRPIGLGTPNETEANWGLSTVGPINTATGDGSVSFASVFEGGYANGNWSLHLHDDGTGDQGSIDAWSLTFATDRSDAAVIGQSTSDFVLFDSLSLTDGSYSTLNRTVVYSGVTGWLIDLNAGNDFAVGSMGNDTIDGGTGTDQLYGGLGDDLFIVTAGALFSMAGETYDGGGGSDSLALRATADLSFDLRLVTLRSIESLDLVAVYGNTFGVVLNASQIGAGLSATAFVDGTAGPQSEVFEIRMELTSALNLSGLVIGAGLQDVNDRFEVIGDGSNETVTGSSITDSISGNAGNDVLRGGQGDDLVSGDAGIDYLYGDANEDRLFGGSEGDHLWGGAGRDFHYGGDGTDYARYDDANHGHLVIRLDNPFLNTGVASFDTYNSIEGLVGGAGNDTIAGDFLSNPLFGSGGDDHIYGHGSNDQLYGGAGGDNLWGGTEADAHDGGDGTDYARYDEGNHGDLTIRLDNSALNAGAAAVGDTYSGIEGLVGGAGADVVIGNASANWLFGSGGADFIDGLAGSDYLNGGVGADRFRFSTALGASNVDHIADFQHLVDDILLVQSIFAGIGPALTADEFRIGMAQDANDRILYNNITGQIFYDGNANAAGGMVLFATVTAGTVLTFDDFVMV